jgi:hypothetical protein
MGTSFRRFQPDGPAAALDAMADARIEETRADELTRVNWIPRSSWSNDNGPGPMFGGCLAQDSSTLAKTTLTPPVASSSARGNNAPISGVVTAAFAAS